VRRPLITPAFFSLMALMATSALAQPSPVTVALSPNGITVGDPAQAVISVTARTDDLAGAPRFPIWGPAWGEAEIVVKGEPVKAGERDGIATWQQRLVLRAFRPGSVPLPPMAIEIPLKAGTVRAQTPAGLALALRSVIPQGETNPIPKPPAAMRPLPLGSRFWWTLGIMAALCLAGFWLVLRKRRTMTAGAGAAQMPALPPFEELAAELNWLAVEPSMLALHTRLSLALRRYLGRRLPFPAVESTTAEVQRQLLSRRVPVARQTVEVLRACDLVKFACQEVNESRGRERVAATWGLAQELESHLAPRQPEALVERLEKAG
jgi:hypothetical protein